MGIDTAAKRNSAHSWGQPWRTLPFPDGAIDQGDRQAVALCYAGILSTIAISYPGRLEYTIPGHRLEFRIPEHHLEYTLPKTADETVGEP